EGDVAKVGVRGFGYWCWKPYIILKTLEKMPENGVLLYCDAGCHLNPAGLPRLYDYVDELNHNDLGIKAFYTHFGCIDVRERRWTKGDVFDYFGCRDQKDITDSLQVAATQVFIRKTAASVQFVREWLAAIEADFSLITDDASRGKNLSGFLEHRHDQSLFSVLFKLRGGNAFPAEETEVANSNNRERYPIWDLRDRGYKDMRFWARVKRWTKGHILLTKIRWEKLKERLFSGK
ncbi:MAG: hypothetical protein II295_02850, partial [Akkermansia sp.]|nr:hypothetical protein [Akkermansia sp.]